MSNDLTLEHLVVPGPEKILGYGHKEKNLQWLNYDTTITITDGSVGVTPALTLTSVTLGDGSAGDGALQFASNDGKDGIYHSGTTTWYIHKNAATQIAQVMLSEQSGFGIITLDATQIRIANGPLSMQGNYIQDAAYATFDERAAAPAAAAGHGYLWVKNTTPSELWFTDDAGTSTKIV